MDKLAVKYRSMWINLGQQWVYGAYTFDRPLLVHFLLAHVVPFWLCR